MVVVVVLFSCCCSCSSSNSSCVSNDSSSSGSSLSLTVLEEGESFRVDGGINNNGAVMVIVVVVIVRDCKECKRIHSVMQTRHQKLYSSRRRLGGLPRPDNAVSFCCCCCGGCSCLTSFSSCSCGFVCSRDVVGDGCVCGCGCSLHPPVVSNRRRVVIFWGTDLDCS